MTVYQFSPFAIPAAVTAVVVMAFAIAIVVTRFSRTSMALLAMAVAAAAWQVACAFLFLIADERTALSWAKIGSASLPFMAPALYQFVASILQTANHRRIIAGLGW